MNQYYDIKTYKQYDRDVKLAVRRGLDMEQLLTVVDMLRKGETLPPKYHNHLLHGDYKGYWECHINPDWLLLYEKDTEIRIISLYRTGLTPTFLVKVRKDNLSPHRNIMSRDCPLAHPAPTRRSYTD